jgi:hypothetical protein
LGFSSQLGACSRRPQYQLNYRLRVAIEIGGQHYAGSSVESVGWYSGGFLTGFDGIGAYNSVAYGEAVVLDLGQNGLLFGLVSQPNATPGFSARNIDRVFTSEMPSDLLTDDAMRSGAYLHHLTGMTGEYAVPRDFWPVFVRFRDIKDPRSAQIILADQIAAVYGPTSSVKSVTLEITKDQVSNRIDSILPWLSNVRGAFLRSAGPANTAPDAAKLTSRCFKLRDERS